MGRRQYFKPARKKNVKASKEEPCQQSCRGASLSSEMHDSLLSSGILAARQTGVEWKKEGSQVGKIVGPTSTASESERSTLIPLLLIILTSTIIIANTYAKLLVCQELF